VCWLRGHREVLNEHSEIFQNQLEPANQKIRDKFTFVKEETEKVSSPKRQIYFFSWKINLIFDATKK
jgi:hypothetical protein